MNERKKESDEEKEIQYSCIVIDDFDDTLKDKAIQRQLNKMLIKARRLCTSFIFALQSYMYFPKMLRKQITYISLWKSVRAVSHCVASFLFPSFRFVKGLGLLACLKDP